MSKVYQYRKHIQWGQYVIAIFFSVFIIFWIFMGVKISFLSTPTPEPFYSQFQSMILVMMVCGGIIFVIEGVLLWYLYYRLAGVRVVIENDAIIYRHRKGETKIKFDKITKIGLPSIPYLGGWITIIAGKEKIRLTVVVREIGDFIQTLKASLDNIGLANRYNEPKLFLFLKTAVFSDQSWDRIYSLFWKLIVATLGMGLLGIGIAKISETGEFFWILLSFVFPTLVYIITEIVYAIRIAKTSIRESFFVPPRDVAYENSVYKVTSVIGIIIYLIMALILMFVLK
ncbi:MAG: hypothetical protein HZB50_04410 [Chloroflexi bacterium]|nr:hypothetical protein [Chloroflexota bacterium]